MSSGFAQKQKSPPNRRANFHFCEAKGVLRSTAGFESAGNPLKYWRRNSESNRGTRICNPLHNHSAIAPWVLHVTLYVKKGSVVGFPLGIWSGKRVSNSRPQPWQGCALPTELFPQKALLFMFLKLRLPVSRSFAVYMKFFGRANRQCCF